MSDSLTLRKHVFACATIWLACWMLPGEVSGEETLAYRQAMAKAMRTAAARVLPSLVTIEVVGTTSEPSSEVQQDAPTTGVIVDPEGFILASSIVTRRPAASILVVLEDGTRLAAKTVGEDQHRDLVLLKVTTDQSLPAVDLSQEVDRRIGETTVAVGRYGNDGSPMVSRGVLSATGRLDGIAIQTDARVSASLYGGLLIDLYGNPLGVLIPAVAGGGVEDSTGWYDSGIAFAIPGNVIADKLERLKKGETIEKGVIGIVAKTSDPYADGTEIAAVRRRSPAEAAGIKSGDVILEIDGEPVRRHQQIRQVLGRFDAGDTVGVKLQRGEETLQVEATLAASIPPLQPQRLGVLAANTASADDDESTGVRIEAVLPDSAADGVLEPDDVLLQLRSDEIDDVQSLRRLLISAEPGAELPLTVRRGDSTEQVTVTPNSIAGPVTDAYPQPWQQPDEDQTPGWETQSIQLPDAANEAAYVAPPLAEDDAEATSSPTRLGLLVLLANPGQGNPETILKDWQELAEQTGVVVCVIAPENQTRWQPKEVVLISKFVAALLKKAPIDPAAVAVGAPGALQGGAAEAGDSMALAVAISQSSVFSGVAIAPQTQPPAIRLRENEPANFLQIMMPVESSNQLPAWAEAIKKAGYPIVLGGKTDRETLLRWTRLLQAI